MGLFLDRELFMSFVLVFFCFFFQTMFFLLLVWQTSGRFSTGVLVLFKVSEVAQ